ncbi:hypothetical protein K437DRAFT_276888 [Tilletiaria anomala UBC 951]|uniref:S1 motif domain-containing protein n=1 Tax=Tilletiaria anomala (strain ATCC 24038 / CBS 436.72 / UBC 951) TaxID=1037660 RepID=A0A066V723_TILAU|nr:uncharacterized protein K437DRAFT_276888 [Tilletiaria anomala UBC 951]KDN36083.1 hypothetical protein K437DRAFT_276888 [Tilletiaria anomala UBC 951]
MSASAKKKEAAGAAGGPAKQAQKSPAAPSPSKKGKGAKKASSKKTSSSSSVKKPNSKAETKPELAMKLKAKAMVAAKPQAQFSSQGASAFQFQDAKALKANRAKNGAAPLERRRKFQPSNGTPSSLAGKAASTFSTPAEIDFPRGGGSSLTPVEYRQTLREARGEAAADAKAAVRDGDLFTDGAGKKGKGRSSSAGLADDREGRAKKKRRGEANSVDPVSAAAAAIHKDAIRVEHLNYNRLAPGSRVLATILAVHPLAVVLSLPNQLLAHVPITQISSIFTERLEHAAMAAEQGDLLDEDEDTSDAESDSDEDNSQGVPQQPRKRQLRESDVPELRDMFAAGQFVIATVISVASPGSLRGQRFGPGREGGEYEKESRRVVCSLDPKDVNASLDVGLAGEPGSMEGSKGDLAPGYVLPVAIKAREDNGWSVDLGLGDSIAGFVPFSETPFELNSSGASKHRKDYPIGQVLPACITSLNSATPSRSKTLLQLSVQPSKLSAASLGPTHAPSLSALMPGLKVNALVTSVSAKGLGVKLWGMFDATVDISHLPPLPIAKSLKKAEVEGSASKTTKGLQDVYKVGAHLTARVLWDQGPARLNGRRRAGGVVGGAAFSLGDEGDSDDGFDMEGMGDNEQDRKIGLSAAEHVLKLESQESIAMQLPIGTDVNATITACDSDWGLNVSVSLAAGRTEDPKGKAGKQGSVLPGFVHISRVSDDHIVRLSATSGAYKLGSTHTARVIGHALTDKLLLLSMQPSILAKSFMRVSQVQVGEVLRATVKEVKPSGIFLNLGGSVDGIVFPLHFSDIVLKKPEKKYKPGMKVNAKVLLVEPARNRIALTLKKTLINSELPIISSIQDARVGMLTHATISKVLEADKGLLVDFFGGTRALVPSSEASESYLTDLRTQFYEGKPLKVRITHVDYATGRLVASIRQALPSFQARLNVDAVELGQQVEATLAAVHQDVIVLSLVPSQVRALLSLSILARHRGVSVEELRDGLQEGEVLKDLVVVSKNQEKGIVIVGTAGSPSARVLTKGTAPKTGDIYEVRVIKESEPTAVTVMLPNKCRGRLHLLDCNDDPANAKLPALDSTVKVVVMNLRQSSSRADVSMRLSVLASATSGAGVQTSSSITKTLVDEIPNKVGDLTVGARLHGYVKSIANAGLFVDIGRYATARVKIAELFDGFVKDWQSKFHVGQMVFGTVTEIDAKHNKVELSLKTGVKGAKQPVASKERKEDKSGKSLRIADFQTGQKVNGFVRGTSKYGVFVQIEGTNISGLCHKSQLADNAPDDALQAFSIGDRVKAVIIEVAEAKNKISFGLKPSYFTAADFADGAAQEEGGLMGEGNEAEGSSNAVGEKDSNMNGMDNEDEDEDDDDAMADAVAGDSEQAEGDGNAFEGDTSDDEDFIEADGFGAQSAVTAADGSSEPTLVPRLELAVGFSWSGNADASASAGLDTISDNSGDSDSDDGAPCRGTNPAKGKGKRSKVTEDITADLATKAPESSTDFERILLGSPNSSYIWIQFMSFHLQLADIDRAREVARRALKIINFREDQERLNVWIALLNLENTYGSDDSLDKIFKEAAQANDAKTIHLRLLQIYERTRKMDKVEELWKKTTKKFGFSSKVWVLYGQYFLRERKAEEARQLLPRSMQSLPKRKHVKTITGFALSEFKIGDAERGRTIFEGLLDTYPKRLDIWLQYIDQEAKVSSIAGSDGKHAAVPRVRALFDRVLSLRQSTKKGKSVLKKWLEFEKRYGTPDGQQAVLQRARAFVEETQNKQGGQAEAQDDVRESDAEDEDEDVEME